MTRHRIGALLLAVIAATSGASLIGGSAAQAAPQGCWSALQPGGAGAFCSYGTGQFRVILGCERDNGTWYYRYGPWLSPGGDQSTAACTGWFEPQYAGVQKRN
jgi:hypothetical protein